MDCFIVRAVLLRKRYLLIKSSKLLEVRSWTGIRLALTFEYLEIRYNKYDEVFINLEDEENLIEDILKINPEINVA